MSILDTALQSLADQMQTHLTVPVIYSRDGASINIRAVRGSTPYEATDQDGLIHRTIARDYLVAADVFPFTDPPRDGDLIADGVETYIVSSVAGSQPYRYSDPHNRILRIHTKRK